MSNGLSPYLNSPINNWPTITDQLIAQHPLSTAEILEISLSAWKAVWSTQIGVAPHQIPLKEVNPPATVIGYFFEKLFAKELASRYPEVWRGGVNGEEKDLHHITNQTFSIEMKASGQLGTKIFGNRSYGQKVENNALAKKDKSGYYITANFFGESLNLIRFGWIDADDWKAQKAATGQMAALDENTYKYKLRPLKGSYTLDAPIELLHGVGAKLAEKCRDRGFDTISSLLAGNNVPKELSKAHQAALTYKANFS